MTTFFVVPSTVDDPTVPSGGNRYDRELFARLPDARKVLVPGSWPHPNADARDRLRQELAQLPDAGVVLVDGLVAGSVPEVVVPQAQRLRIVVLVHLPLAAETGLTHEVAVDLDRREHRVLHAARAIVATSVWSADALVRRHGLDAERVHAVLPGVDTAPLAEGTDGVSRLLCVASVTPRKGHDVLVDALAGVADRTWRCRFVGPWRAPDFLAVVREKIARHGLDRRVELVGAQSSARLAVEYDAADLVVLPSRSETYGMVVTEALARAVPVVASTVDGVPEALGVTPDGAIPGLLVAPGDAVAWSAALNSWFSDPALRERLRGAARRRRAMLESWDATSGRLAALLDRMHAP
ncbi:glycosyltransferase family 4 protein [Allosaccharopolyspora coralli]|uniref:glycosyltransferase family 4 protein n=1 Tax=Allosaccharopolyspora coralli TaxID=2665642 RepID=UPI001E50BCCD|nr:glycosyltransferase family 4 protein [Allosaccharopolyspora coralli]